MPPLFFEEKKESTSDTKRIPFATPLALLQCGVSALNTFTKRYPANPINSELLDKKSILSSYSLM
jgi:hypothetical protein